MIMRVFGFGPLRRTHFAIVGQHRRAAQTDHPHCCDHHAKHDTFFFFFDFSVIFQKSVSKREHGVSSRLSRTKCSLFVITGLCMSLQVPV